MRQFLFTVILVKETGIKTSVVIVTDAGVDCILVTVAVLVISPVFFGFTTIVTIAISLGASVPRSQVTIPAIWPQPLDADIKSTLGGSVSVRMTLVAEAGPLLVTVIW